MGDMAKAHRYLHEAEQYDMSHMGISALRHFIELQKYDESNKNAGF